MRMIHVLCGAIAAGLALSAQAVTWDMPTPYGETNFHTVNIKGFADDVKAATGGKLEIKIHSGGSLFKHPEIKNAVRGGQVPIGEFLLSRLSNENAVFQVDSVPFLATNYKQAEVLWKASKPTVEKLLDKEGLMVLFAVPWPPQGLYAKKPLNSVDDLKGVKFRAYNTATEELAKLAGAIPTQVEVPDIPQAFSTGRVDAMITSPSTGANTKAWDFVTHFYHTQAWLPKNIVVVNKRAFRKLDKDVQNAVLEAAMRAEERGWEASKAETNEKIAVLRENGMQVHDPSATLMQGLQDIGRKMTHDWSATAGEAGVKIIDQYYSMQ
ncbi:MAG: TRAP transporter substrate-binding protein [Gammaproteobacteria bacterium]|nr:TRAP transporter substrate-binding protein [Gammaproteobacteria bacterium]